MNELQTLDTLPVGGQAKVTRISAPGPVRQRLLTMGITPGTLLTVRGVAPLGDPIDVEVRGYDLSLRREEAKYVHVEVI